MFAGVMGSAGDWGRCAVWGAKHQLHSVCSTLSALPCRADLAPDGQARRQGVIYELHFRGVGGILAGVGGVARRGVASGGKHVHRIMLSRSGSGDLESRGRGSLRHQGKAQKECELQSRAVGGILAGVVGVAGRGVPSGGKIQQRSMCSSCRWMVTSVASLSPVPVCACQAENTLNDTRGIFNQSINQIHLSSTLAGRVQGDCVFSSSKPLSPEPALPKGILMYEYLSSCNLHQRCCRACKAWPDLAQVGHLASLAGWTWCDSCLVLYMSGIHMYTGACIHT